MHTKEQLDFAYKYPFSDEAKEIIKNLDFKSVEQMHLITGRARLEEAFESGKIEYRESNYGRLDFVVGYAYARMLVSAIKNLGLISKYANAEAKRASEALEKDTDVNILRLAKELGIDVRRDNGGFMIDFTQFLANAPIEQDFTLANQKLVNGTVMLGKHQLIKVMEVAIGKAVAKGLPVKATSIPKIVIEYSKGVKLPIQKTIFRRGTGGGISWIDKLLNTAIPDCRHRTVNLVLAPYLVNVKGLPVDKATEMISNYIALCKTVNPDTKITDRYIKYQCDYAKSHGLKPLSLARAKTELGGGIDFGTLLGEDTQTELVK
ncbi:MAG: DNA primase noncatalytic subunit PriX [Candidatus Micrarchaeales archaeon]